MPHPLMKPSSSFVVLACSAILFSGGCPLLGSEEEELPPILRSFAPVEDPVPPFEEGRFLPREGETVSLLGGTDLFEEQRRSHLEMRLHLAFPELGLRVRHLAWQGDTIFHQARPAHFYTRVGDTQPGSVPDSRERTEPGIVFLAFGKMESLEGPERLGDFLGAYRDLLEGLADSTGRVVLLGPTPFFPTGPAASLAEERNEALAPYAEGIRQLAAERGLIHVDLFDPLRQSLAPSLSTNGVHLSESGHARFAEIVAEGLDLPAPAVPLPREAAGSLDALHDAVSRKNHLWQQYYRPTNWAFLFGDRQHVPASRGHEDREERWFIEEVDAIPPILAEAEEDIRRYALEAAGK